MSGNSPKSDTEQTILIADDDESLVQAIMATLDREDLQTVVAHDGEQTLKLAQQLRPDLILLDVTMPGKSGIAVCSVLKKAPATASIPIVLITARKQQRDRQAGIIAGADAYLTKPFSPTQLINLVNHMLARRPAVPQHHKVNLTTMPSDQLVVYAQELRKMIEQEQHQREDLEAARRRLDELDQLKAAFLGAVTHELLTPFAIIGLPLQILQKQSEHLTLSQQNALDDLATEIAGLHQMIKGIVKFAELVHKRRQPQPGHYALDQIIPGAVQALAILAQARQVDFRCLIPSGLPTVHVDPELLGEAVYQMAHNAVKFNLPEGRAQVRAFESGKWVVIEVSDTGVGLTPERLAILGQPFEQSADALCRGREGLGIGWAFVSYVARVHGGRRHVKSSGPGQGSTFSLALPLCSTMTGS